MAKRKQAKRKKEQSSSLNPAAKPGVTSKPVALISMVRSGRFRFPLSFTLSCIALYAIIYSLPPSFTGPVNENVAATLGLVLHGFGIPVTVVNDIVAEGALAFRIVPDCTPLFTSGLFLSFVMFYPATYRQKAMGLLTGIPALYLGNLARLTATFMISRYERRLFDIVHVYLGQVFTMLLVLIVCIIWLKWLERKEPEQSMPVKAAGFLGRFALISVTLFLLWGKVHYGYIWFLDRFVLFGFSLFGYHVPLAHHTLYYYETFSIVVLISLFFSLRWLQAAVRKRWLVTGLGIMMFTHLLHRIDNVFMAYFTFTGFHGADLILLVIGQYLLPALLWFSCCIAPKRRGSKKQG
ncbi:MAG: exosortase H [Nitrospiraceae bacterium]|nr:MAG: exosortase H [Nitrospiraceae bacterium]